MDAVCTFERYLLYLSYLLPKHQSEVFTFQIGSSRFTLQIGELIAKTLLENLFKRLFPDFVFYIFLN